MKLELTLRPRLRPASGGTLASVGPTTMPTISTMGNPASGSPRGGPRPGEAYSILGGVHLGPVVTGCAGHEAAGSRDAFAEFQDAIRMRLRCARVAPAGDVRNGRPASASCWRVECNFTTWRQLRHGARALQCRDDLRVIDAVLAPEIAESGSDRLVSYDVGDLVDRDATRDERRFLPACPRPYVSPCLSYSAATARERFRRSRQRSGYCGLPKIGRSAHSPRF